MEKINETKSLFFKKNQQNWQIFSLIKKKGGKHKFLKQGHYYLH
jgi:hypothetical protein